MKILFVSGVAAGGAPKSTVELARMLAKRDHTVQVLLTERPSDRSPFGLVSRLHLKLRALPILGVATNRWMRTFGRSVRLDSRESGLDIYSGSVAENGYRSIAGALQPDVIVANSLPRIAFKTLSEDLEGETPLVLYMREAHSVTHLTISGLRPAHIVGNARGFCEQVGAMGLQSSFVPSIIDLGAAAVESTRQTVIMINPIAENRPELLFAFAQERPDTTFVLQESWPLPAEEKSALQRAADGLTNVEFRSRVESPAEVYSDVRLLVATYPTGRPRVVVEAQYNGIPVVALNQPALAEATGPTDTLLDASASDHDWLAAIERYLDDGEFYEEASQSARQWARRPEIANDRIAADFEEAMCIALAGVRRGI